MQPLKSGFDAQQLLHITKNCRRWSGIESLPAAIRTALQELDALTEYLQTQTASSSPGILALVKSSCLSLKTEFSRSQILFDCPACPLRTSV